MNYKIDTVNSRKLIELENVTKIYQTNDGPVESLKPLSFHINEGEFVSVVGPSGCGKSTLLKLVAGLLPISGGNLKLAGKNIDGPQKNVGIVFQSAVLLAWRNVLDNILLQAEIRHMPMEPSKARALQLIKMAGLTGFEKKFPWQLSGGMQQRASIARALSFEPRILMMDEPFGALDEITRDRLNEQLQQLWQRERRTVVFVTHSIAEAVYLSTRIVVMSPRPGRIVRVIESTLPDERHLGLRDSPEFVALAHAVREALADGHDE